MTSIAEYKNKKIAEIEKDINRIEDINARYMREELKEKNTGKVNIENIAALTAELSEMRTGAGTGTGSAYTPESFM